MPPKTAQTPKTARIEVFRTGTFTPMQGGAITFAAADLKAMADAYSRDTAPAPVVVGHPTTNAPAYAWADGFSFDPLTGVMSAEIGEIDPAFAELVQAGRYKKVSLELHSPQSSNNPTPGAWYPKHIGFLGAAAPAVTGLKNVAFASEGEVATFTAAFGDPIGEETSSILRALREFFIEKFGLDEADKALPSWRIEWLGEMEPEKTPGPAFSAPTDPKPKEETQVSKDPVITPDPAFAARETSLTAREASIAAREAELANSANVSFAANLVAEGRLLPALEPKVVALLNALPGEASVSFAAGEAKIAPAAALKAVLSEMAKVVSFGRMDLPEGDDKATVSFASDGLAVDPDGLALHRKALAYTSKHPETSYLDAVRAVS